MSDLSKINSLFMNDIEYEFYLANENKDYDNESCMHFGSSAPSPTSFFVINKNSSSKFVTKKQHLITGAKYNFTAVKFLPFNKISKVAYVKMTNQTTAATRFAHYKTDKVNNDQIMKCFGRQTRSVPSKLSRQKRELEYFLPIDSVIGLGKRFPKNSSASDVVMNDDSIYYAGSLGLELSNFGTLRYTLPGFKGFQECDDSIASIYGLPYQRVFDALFSA